MWLKNWKPPTIISKFVSRSLRITSPVRIKNYDQKKKCSVCLGRTPDPCSPAPLCHGVCRSLIYAAGGGCYRMFGSKHKYKFFFRILRYITNVSTFTVCNIHPSIHPGATTHAGSWPTQEIASNHLCPWPWSSNFWLPASLYPSSFHPSIWGLVFPLTFCPPVCPRWFSYMVDYLAFVLYILPIWALLS